MSTEQTTRKPFLALTKKYGWVVVQRAPPGWGGYLTVPGKYAIHEQDILRDAKLPDGSAANAK